MTPAEFDDAVVISALTPRTTPDRFYLPPKPCEVTKCLQTNKLAPTNYDMLADVINLMSGGKFTDGTQDSTEANSWARQTLPPPNSRGNWRLTYPREIDGEEQSSTSDREVAVADRTQERLNYHVHVRELLRALDNEYGLYNLPGWSPLQKAVSLLRLLAKQQKEDDSPFGAPGSIGPNALARKIKDAVELAKQTTAAERGLLSPTTFGGNDGGGDPSSEMQVVAMAEDMMTGRALMLKIARHLSSLSRMTIGRSYERVIDPEGRILDPRRIEDFNSLNRLSSTEWAYPTHYRNYRVITQQARVYERVHEKARKQCIYMIVDCSGSMSGERTYIAGGCIMRGLRGVYDDDAELYLRLFDTQLKEEMCAKTKPEAQSVMSKILNGNFSGGGTRIAACTKAAIARIRELVEQQGLAKPELVLVTDGEDDTTSLVLDDFAGVKFHAVLVHNSSGRQEHLLQLAQATGGVGINIPVGMF